MKLAAVYTRNSAIVCVCESFFMFVYRRCGQRPQKGDLPFEKPPKGRRHSVYKVSSTGTILKTCYRTAKPGERDQNGPAAYLVPIIKLQI